MLENYDEIEGGEEIGNEYELARYDDNINEIDHNGSFMRVRERGIYV